MSAMDERVVQFRVGVLVLATAIIGAVLILLFRAQPAFWRGTYSVNIRLVSAGGVTDGTPVKKRGVLIGRVTKVVLEEQSVLVTADIDRDISISRDETCVLRNTVLGDAELEFEKAPVLSPAPQATTTAVATPG